MDLPIHAELISDEKISVPANEVIFPICQWINEKAGLYQILGTGFFVCTDGIFLTAKHVIVDERGEIIPDLFAITFLSGLKFLIRPFNYKDGALSYIKCHALADVAAGHLAQATHNKTGHPLTNKILALEVNGLFETEIVASYGYPKDTFYFKENKVHVATLEHWQFGKVLEMHRTGRGGLLPGPCYMTDLSIPHGASGGPVTNQSGRVVGINSTGWNGQNISYISRIEDALELGFDIVQTTGGSQSMSLRKMAELGYLKVEGISEL